MARHGLTGTQYQDLFDDLTADGYRLHQVDSYLDGGNVRYAAIFDKRSGPPFAAFHGLTTAEYDQQVDDLAAAGFVAVNVSTVEVGGNFYWTALFEQVSVVGWTVETVSAANYQATFDANVDAGRRPIYVHGFDSGAGPQLTGIWVDPIGGGIQAVHGLSSNDYQTAYDTNITAQSHSIYPCGQRLRQRRRQRSVCCSLARAPQYNNYIHARCHYQPRHGKLWFRSRQPIH